MNGYSYDRTVYDRIVRVVQAHTRINRMHIMSQRRHAPIADARALAMYLSYHISPRSSSIMVGRYFGRDHTTVLTAIAKIEDAVASSAKFAERVAALQRGLEA
jgi:chromosomal replication initiator protein